MKEFILCGEKQ